MNLEDVMDPTNFLFILLELAEAGELFDKVIKKMKLKKAEAKLLPNCLGHQEPAFQEDLSQVPEA